MCDLRDKYKYYCQWFLFECTTNTYFGTGSYVIALVIVLSSVTRAANETLTKTYRVTRVTYRNYRRDVRLFVS